MVVPDNVPYNLIVLHLWIGVLKGTFDSSGLAMELTAARVNKKLQEQRLRAMKKKGTCAVVLP